MSGFSPPTFSHVMPGVLRGVIGLTHDRGRPMSHSCTDCMEKRQCWAHDHAACDGRLLVTDVKLRYSKSLGFFSISVSNPFANFAGNS